MSVTPESTRRLLVLLAPLLCACTGAYGQLLPEEQIPELGYLKSSADKLPSRTVFQDSGAVHGIPLQVALHEVGYGDKDHVLVFVHGVLSDSRAWRFMRGALGHEYDLLLVDLPGCGQSDQPSPVLLGPDGYGPTALAQRVLTALRAQLTKRHAPATLTLIGHSLGGTIALRMLSEPTLRREFHDVLMRVDRLIVLSPMDIAMEKIPPVFTQLAKLSGAAVHVASALGLLRKYSSQATRLSVVDPCVAPQQEVDRFLEVLLSQGRFRAAQAMLSQAVPLRKDLRPDWTRIEPLVTAYANVQIPTLILWGARDETLSVAMGYKLAAELPNARLRIVRNSMHSLLWERPTISAQLIREFLGGRLDTGPRVAQVASQASRPDLSEPSTTSGCRYTATM